MVRASPLGALFLASDVAVGAVIVIPTGGGRGGGGSAIVDGMSIAACIVSIAPILLFLVNI